jgi:hypothetical protein
MLGLVRGYVSSPQWLGYVKTYTVGTSRAPVQIGAHSQVGQSNGRLFIITTVYVPIVWAIIIIICVPIVRAAECWDSKFGVEFASLVFILDWCSNERWKTRGGGRLVKEKGIIWACLVLTSCGCDSIEWLCLLVRMYAILIRSKRLVRHCIIHIESV